MSEFRASKYYFLSFTLMTAIKKSIINTIYHCNFIVAFMDFTFVGNSTRPVTNSFSCIFIIILLRQIMMADDNNYHQSNQQCKKTGKPVCDKIKYFIKSVLSSF